MDAFVIKHIFILFLMDFLMLWHFHQVNKILFRVVGDTTMRKAFEIMKFGVKLFMTLTNLFIGDLLHAYFLHFVIFKK
jgi:hypothetical protein